MSVKQIDNGYVENIVNNLKIDNSYEMANVFNDFFYFCCQYYSIAKDIPPTDRSPEFNPT